MEKWSSFCLCKFQIRSASEGENSNEVEEPDPPSTAADVRKALHTLRRALENQRTEQEMYEQYYSLAKNIESNLKVKILKKNCL